MDVNGRPLEKIIEAKSDKGLATLACYSLGFSFTSGLTIEQVNEDEELPGEWKLVKSKDSRYWSAKLKYNKEQA
jgi:hypothetical protein